MRKIKIIKTGKIQFVENNVAHGMIEKGEAVLVRKAFNEAPKDKMFSEKKKVLRKK